MSLYLSLLVGCWPDIRGLDYVPWDTAAFAEEPKVVNGTRAAASRARWWTRAAPRPGSTSTSTRAGSSSTGTWPAGTSACRASGLARRRGLRRRRRRGRGARRGRLEDVTTAPTDGFATDLADDDDENSEPEYAFDVWFDYDSQTHVLTPADKVFVVRTTEDWLFAMEVVSYYDDAGSSGVLELRWKRM